MLQNHKNNTSSGAPCRMVISNIWGIQMRSIVWGKSQRDLSRPPAPSSLFSILSWATLMWTRWLKNKALWLDLIPVENWLAEWGGHEGRRGGECSFIRETQETKITFQPVYQSARREGDTAQGERAGCEKRSSSWSLCTKGPPLSCWVPLGSCPPHTMLVERPAPPQTPLCPPTALHVLELRWQPGPQTSAYGGQTKGPDLRCAPQLELCWGRAAVLHATTCWPLTLRTHTHTHFHYLKVM